MEIQLISGTFTIMEAELLTAIFTTKIAFHVNRIQTIRDAGEDSSHAENRVMLLQHTLRTAIDNMKQKGQSHTCLNAYIEVNTIPRLTQ